MQQLRQTTAILLLTLFVYAVYADTADARLLGRRRGGSATGNHGEYSPTEYSTEKRYAFNGVQLSLQDIAQMRADAMAKRQTLTHGIHAVANVPAAPVAEGIGVSVAKNYKTVSTCICGSTVVADAWCKGRNGSTYRVRFWR